MTSRVLNFLWLNLDLPAKPDPVDGSIHPPVPAHYIENVRKAAKAQPAAQMVLWVDSKRQTERQMAWLKEQLETGVKNVKLRDLRSIPAYDQEALYNEGETSPKWRTDQCSLIWRQVDCAKILVCLQKGYDQTFFADLDHAHLPITSNPIQTMLREHGIMVGSGSDAYLSFENQLWGFTEQRYKFFEDYYKEALKIAYRDKVNAYYELAYRLGTLLRAEKIEKKDICLAIMDDGTQASHEKHPDHELHKKQEEQASRADDAYSGGHLTTAYNSLPAESSIGQNKKIPSAPQKQHGDEMTSRIVNFLWLNLDLPAKPDPEDGTIRQPLPEKYIATLRNMGEQHPDAEVVLWVDSQRLTEKQMAYLKDKIEAGLGNVLVKDLRSLPEYDSEHLYNQPETNSRWRIDQGKTSIIWRQVDCAKILISLQGHADQKFFSDLDHAHFDLTGEEVQGMLEKHGFMVGSDSSHPQFRDIENQLWGFTERRKEFFENYYQEALKAADAGNNAWKTLRYSILKLISVEKIDLNDICLPIDGDRSQATHPDHKFRNGDGLQHDLTTTNALPPQTKPLTVKARPRVIPKGGKP